MTKMLIQCFAIALLTQSTCALPSLDRRSGILGLGDSGGDNRDESLNQALNVFGDSMLSGQNNLFAPDARTGGIDAVGLNRVRRSGVLGLGDSGGQNRDESLNQALNIFGDSFMTGKDNKFVPTAEVGGIDGVALNRFRRSGVLGLGDSGGQNRDDSLNQALTIFGDSFMTGQDNKFVPTAEVGGIDGVALSRFRRSGILGLGDNGGKNEDESENQNLVIFGDSFMSGKNNNFAPSASIDGIDGVGTSHVRRGGILGMGDSGGSNTDQSTSQSMSTIGDDFMGGTSNVFNPTALIGGVGAIPLGRRGGILGLGENSSQNSDSSKNQNLFIKGDSILTGEQNSFTPSLDIGGIDGVGRSIVKRSGILGLGDNGGSNRDESDNQNLVLFGDDFMSGKSNTFAPEASIAGIDGVGTSHVRRGGILGFGDNSGENSDSSKNQNIFTKGDSILTGQQNSFTPGLDIGGIDGVGSSFVKRSGILGLGDNGGSNRDESDNQNLVLFGDDFMSGKSNTFAPEASIAGIDGVGTSHVN